MARIKKYDTGGYFIYDNNKYKIDDNLIKALYEYSNTLDTRPREQFGQIIKAIESAKNSNKDIQYNSSSNVITGVDFERLTTRQQKQIKEGRSTAGRILGSLWGGKGQQTAEAIDALRGFNYTPNKKILDVSSTLNLDLDYDKNSGEWIKDEDHYIIGTTPENSQVIARLNALKALNEYDDIKGYGNLTKDAYDLGIINSLITAFKQNKLSEENLAQLKDLGIIPQKYEPTAEYLETQEQAAKEKAEKERLAAEKAEKDKAERELNTLLQSFGITTGKNFNIQDGNLVWSNNRGEYIYFDPTTREYYNIAGDNDFFVAPDGKVYKTDDPFVKSFYTAIQNSNGLWNTDSSLIKNVYNPYQHVAVYDTTSNTFKPLINAFNNLYSISNGRLEPMNDVKFDDTWTRMRDPSSNKTYYVKDGYYYDIATQQWFEKQPDGNLKSIQYPFSHKNGGILKCQGGKYLTNEEIRRAKQNQIEQLAQDLQDKEDKNKKLGYVASGLDGVGIVLGWIPGAHIAGTALGAASSTLRFGKDWWYDGLDSGDFVNFGINSALDAASLIPFVSGAKAGKVAKVAATASKTGKTSKAVKALGTTAQIAADESKTNKMLSLLGAIPATTSKAVKSSMPYVWNNLMLGANAYTMSQSLPAWNKMLRGENLSPEEVDAIVYSFGASKNLGHHVKTSKNAVDVLMPTKGSKDAQTIRLTTDLHDNAAKVWKVSESLDIPADKRLKAKSVMSDDAKQHAKNDKGRLTDISANRYMQDSGGNDFSEEGASRILQNYIPETEFNRARQHFNGTRNTLISDPARRWSSGWLTPYTYRSKVWASPLRLEPSVEDNEKENEEINANNFVVYKKGGILKCQTGKGFANWFKGIGDKVATWSNKQDWSSIFGGINFATQLATLSKNKKEMYAAADASARAAQRTYTHINPISYNNSHLTQNIQNRTDALRSQQVRTSDPAYNIAAKLSTAYQIDQAIKEGNAQQSANIINNRLQNAEIAAKNMTNSAAITDNNNAAWHKADVAKREANASYNAMVAQNWDRMFTETRNKIEQTTERNRLGQLALDTYNLNQNFKDKLNKYSDSYATANHSTYPTLASYVRGEHYQEYQDLLRDYEIRRLKLQYSIPTTQTPSYGGQTYIDRFKKGGKIRNVFEQLMLDDSKIKNKAIDKLDSDIRKLILKIMK